VLPANSGRHPEESIKHSGWITRSLGHFKRSWDPWLSQGSTPTLLLRGNRTWRLKSCETDREPHPRFLPMMCGRKKLMYHQTHLQMYHQYLKG
jgi:hypothetical protein